MASSSSLNQMSTNSNGNSNFQCATGAFCKLPSVNFSHSLHKCFFCQCMLHGICGILHDPNNITYQNHCNYCDAKYNMSQHQLPTQSLLFSSLIPACQTCSLPSAMNAVQPCSVTMVRTEVLLPQITENSTRTPTPTGQLFTIAASSSLWPFHAAILMELPSLLSLSQSTLELVSLCWLQNQRHTLQ